MTSITLDEYARRGIQHMEGREITTISVLQHKTASKGAAVLMLEPLLADEVSMWHESLRLALLPHDCQLLFAERSGRPLDHLTRKLQQLGQRLGFELPSSTNTRKAVVTQAAQQSATLAQREALAAHMCHSVRTSAVHYEKCAQIKKKSEGYSLSKSLLHGEERSEEGSSGVGVTPLRRRFTSAEEELIRTHFSTAVEHGRPPVTTEAREFLQLYPTSFTGRSPKDIIDKVRTIIRRNQ